MSAQMISVPSGQLLDYTVSLTLGYIDTTVRWTDTLGGTTDKMHGGFPIADVAAYETANQCDRSSALCALLKQRLATQANTPVDQLTISITPFARTEAPPDVVA